jgi:hypothetical protein
MQPKLPVWLQLLQGHNHLLQRQAQLLQSHTLLLMGGNRQLGSLGLPTLLQTQHVLLLSWLVQAFHKSLQHLQLACMASQRLP